jgi:hypothetical protein
MHLWKLSLLIAALAGPLLVDAQPASGLLAPPGTKLPFIERIPPADFLLVEAKLPEALSDSSELVILRTSGRDLVYSLAVRKAAKSEYEVVLLDASPNEADRHPDTAQRRVVPLDAKSAEQIERAVEIKLHRNVYLADGIRTAESDSKACWILFRPKTSQPMAALIDFESVHMNPEAHDFMDRILWGLYHFATCHPDDRNDVLYEIDRQTIQIILTEEAKK